jgi:hypothetical protein
VLNVIEDPAERLETLFTAWRLAKRLLVLEAAGEGAILAGQAEPHCECSMAVSGDGMA